MLPTPLPPGDPRRLSGLDVLDVTEEERPNHVGTGSMGQVLVPRILLSIPSTRTEACASQASSAMSSSSSIYSILQSTQTSVAKLDLPTVSLLFPLTWITLVSSS
ncbi:MAG: hypothetical protein FRX48_02228 [Lasallia pustulata]|uniref:Uncharacterized protein n=1 Tax=Lasallia pustulata TaxID=136370 RepID=A0A5M8PXS7_9LECA|nr:MAG: hypothetical protein FRX48_02228 [Lasallia pustulata]